MPFGSIFGNARYGAILPGSPRRIQPPISNDTISSEGAIAAAPGFLGSLTGRGRTSPAAATSALSTQIDSDAIDLARDQSDARDLQLIRAHRAATEGPVDGDGRSEPRNMSTRRPIRTYRPSRDPPRRPPRLLTSRAFALRGPNITGSLVCPSGRCPNGPTLMAMRRPGAGAFKNRKDARGTAPMGLP